jgi:uncharacterized protein (DUF1501 family)
MKRRQFLRTVALASATTVGGIGTYGQVGHTTAGGRQKRLVVVFLRGGVDGLNVVIPYQEARYYQVRPSIAVPRPGAPGGAIDLDGYFGLHPALAPLMPFWQQGSLAFIHACGSPDQTRSHFDAQTYMESGTPGLRSTNSGWMNRLLTVLPGASPVRAVTVGATIPWILQGQARVANLSLGLAATIPVALDQDNVRAEFDRLYQQGALGQTYQTGLEVRKTQLDALRGASMRQPVNPTGYSASLRFVQTCEQLAQLMVQESQIRLAFLELDGWDTHIDQGGSSGFLADRLKAVGAGLAALAQGLGPVFEDTVIAVLSEFGRTVEENGNGGTEHGHGNALWLLGGVRGGKVYGDWRGLENSQLHEGRELPVTTDFRDPVAMLLQQHMGIESASLRQIFPDYSFRHSLNLI